MREPLALALLGVFIVVPAARVLGVIGSDDGSTASTVSVLERADRRGAGTSAPPPAAATVASTRPTVPSLPAPTATEPVSAPAFAPPPTVETRATPTSSFVAAARSSGIDVYVDPASPRPSLHLSPTTEFGTPRALLVVRAAGDWLQVLLPVRPNNATGWIRRNSIDLAPSHDEVVVDREAHVLQWIHDTTIVLETPVAVGAPSSPTPPGAYFVTDVLPGGGAYGSFILALNGHSDTYTEFGGGDARLALHGTNDPRTIGTSASHGCVRLPNDLIARLASNLAPGTPVTIR